MANRKVCERKRLLSQHFHAETAEIYKKSKKYLSEENLSPGLETNTGPPEYEPLDKTVANCS
jgi:hypothetical protein